MIENNVVLLFMIISYCFGWFMRKQYGIYLEKEKGRGV